MIIERKQYLNELIKKKDNGRIKIITGIRRCGKSYLLFKLYKDYYIAKEMFNYINNYANYRKSAFKDYAKHEIHKNSHLKVSLKDRDKSEELKKLEKENKEKHIKEIKQLEKENKELDPYPGDFGTKKVSDLDE